LVAGQAEPGKRAKVIEAERFIMRDAKGTVRAELAWSDGDAGLTLFDAKGKRRTRFVLSGDGLLNLSVYDRNGTDRAVLQVQPDGEPLLKLSAEQGKLLSRTNGPAKAKTALAPEQPVRPASAPGPPKMDSRLQGAAGLYRRLCVDCHEADGRGERRPVGRSSLPDFTDRSWHASRSDGRLLASIRNGRGTEMPPFDDRLSLTQARDLVAYIRAFNPAKAGEVATGGANDFDKRLKELQKQWDDLDQQLRELNSRSQKK
jgi:mono/diheme cytochrome c family protein